jgi:mxaA protein
MNRIRAACLLLALALAPMRIVSAAEPATRVADSASTPALIEQPRSFGHLLGDVITQRARIDQPGGALARSTLPGVSRVDLWLERWPSRIETDAQGRDWIAIDYQVINAPQELIAIALPALALPGASGPGVTLAAWPISIGPLTPAETFGQGDLQALRPDRPVALRPVYRLQQQLQGALFALMAVLVAWAGWWVWRNRREAQQLPFAQAWRALQRLDDPASPQAWRLVHHALNRAAGRVMQGASLPQLLTQAPYLQALQPQLEAFYRESTQRFFMADTPADRALAAYPLKALSRALRDAEQRHQR